MDSLVGLAIIISITRPQPVEPAQAKKCHAYQAIMEMECNLFPGHVSDVQVSPYTGRMLELSKIS